MAYSVSEISNMYKNISVNLSFVKLTNLHDMPLPFPDNRFYADYDEYIFNIHDLLKTLKEFVDINSFSATSYDQEETSSTVSPARDSNYEEVIAEESSILEETIENNEIDICSTKFQKALARLNDCLTEDNIAAIRRIQQKNLTEDDIVTGVGIHLIQKLSGVALTNKGRSGIDCPCGCSENLAVGEKMCIGTDKTWHGNLNMLSLGVGVSVTKDIEETEVTAADDDSGDDNDNDEDGEYSYGEFKPGLQQKDSLLNQLLSQTVVFGWTEYNRHKNMSPYIPTIFIDSHKFLFLLYSPVEDSLIAARDSVLVINEKLQGLHRYSGIVALWIILNYRLFFRKKIVGIIEEPCGFKSQVNIEPYKNLQTFKSNIRTPTYVNMKFSSRTCLKRDLVQPVSRLAQKRKRSSE